MWYNIENSMFINNNKYSVIVAHGSIKCWYVNNLLHRENGPAIECANGTKMWYRNGQRHRDDGPSVETNVHKSWYRNGQFHREDGPAIEYADGDKVWFLNGKSYTEVEFNKLYDKIHDQDLQH